MRMGWVQLAIAVTLCATAARAEEKQAGPQHKAPVAAKKQSPHRSASPDAAQVAVAEGDIPPMLAGTWLVVRNSKIGDRYMNGTELFRISHTGKEWRFLQLFGSFPPALTAKIAEANNQGVKFTPTEDQLNAVPGALPSFTPQRANDRPKNVWLRTPKFFVKSPDPDPRSKDAKFSLDLLYPSKRGVAASGTSFYIKEVSDDRLGGDFDSAILANQTVGGLIPIALEGPFTMYRVKGN